MATILTHFLHDYVANSFQVSQVLLNIYLDPKRTKVEAELTIVPQKGERHSGPLILDGIDLEIIALTVDGKRLKKSDYCFDKQSLTLYNVPRKSFKLQQTILINPAENRCLSGLYLSQGTFCTQCEAQGFRRIIYMFDRPDVLAKYRVRLYANKKDYPVLLSNGNCVAKGEDGASHWAEWNDPFPKPSYLFALVAGKFDVLSDTYTTLEKKEVQCSLYVAPGSKDLAHHGLASLLRAMAWDEKIYHRVCDVKHYNVVAVADFNFGAMENKGLNIFNSRYILGDQHTATDQDLHWIESVIGHEYFHNWSGNRVTLRDWFQLSLKEGLTIFREQSFSAACSEAFVQRIADVRALCSAQFTEDSGPMAHPVQPQSYQSIENFYTATVYNKGGELIRMLHLILGAQSFYQAMDVYFARFDGQAVTIDDYLQVMQEHCKQDLTQFKRWYIQAGTPKVEIETVFDEETGRYLVHCQQETISGTGEVSALPFMIPIKCGFLDENGQEMRVSLVAPKKATGRSFVLMLTEKKQTFEFVGINNLDVVPSWLRDFSAPVKLVYEYTDAQLITLLTHDPDFFNRWQAGVQLFYSIVQRIAHRVVLNQGYEVPYFWLEALRRMLVLGKEKPVLLAELLTFPSLTDLMEQLPDIAFDVLHQVRQDVLGALAQHITHEAQVYYEWCMQKNKVYVYHPSNVARRKLAGVCLHYLVQGNADQAKDLCCHHIETSDNLTDIMGGLNALNAFCCQQRTDQLAAFYHQIKAQPLLVDKWFALQAKCSDPRALPSIQALLAHPAYDRANPNRVSALLGTFATVNVSLFHSASGQGYAWVADEICKLDRINPNTAARLAKSLVHFRRLDGARQQKIVAQLKRIKARPRLSLQVQEVVNKALALAQSKKRPTTASA
jgi:aminopeptidase N